VTTGPSDSELAKLYWRRQAQQLRAQLEESNPSMKPTGGSGTKPWKPVEEAAIAGASSRAFLTAFGNSGSETVTPKVSPSDVAAAKGRIIEAMVAAGRDTKYIEDAMLKISPHLDLFALSSDPAVQSVLLQRIMNNNPPQNLGMRDLIDAVKLVTDLRNTTPLTSQSDPASVMNAAGNLFRTGVETARGRNDGIDMSQVLQMQQQSHDRMIQAQQEHFKEIRELQSQTPTLVDSLKQYRELQGLVGTAPDKPEVMMKRLDLQAAADQREHEYRLESAKEKRQSEMIKGIGGTIGKALESPILREAGRKMAETVPGVGKVAGAVSGVQTSAARATLNEPLQEIFGLKCSQCGTDHRFTRGQLTIIESSPTKMWACPNCGASYSLKPQGGTDTMAGKNDEPGAS